MSAAAAAENLQTIEQSLTSWTDDIPICKSSGIGSATNEFYRKDGRRVELHPNEDRSFHFKVAEYNLCLYGIFDGFDGTQVADFAMKKLPAEILLGQLSQNSPDDTVKEVLRQSFISVDREYFACIGESLASRMVMKFDPRTPKDDPTLARLEKKTLTGSTATVALILNDKLFVSNIGDTKAVVFCQKPNGEFKVIKLSIDHTLKNEDELLRLEHLGLQPDQLQKALGQISCTRCLGFHKVKGGHKEVDEVKGAKDEPVISDPEIHGGIPIDETFLFLAIYSSPIENAMMEISGGGSDTDTTLELCKFIHDHFKESTTVTGVAQSVVDKLVRLHREQFETDSDSLRGTCREDMSLLLRNFSCRLAPGAQRRRSSGRLSGGQKKASFDEKTITTKDSSRHGRATRSSTTTESSDVFVKQVHELPVDENGRIQPYVDFTHFNQEWEKHMNGLNEQIPDPS